MASARRILWIAAVFGLFLWFEDELIRTHHANHPRAPIYEVPRDTNGGGGERRGPVYKVAAAGVISLVAGYFAMQVVAIPFRLAGMYENLGRWIPACWIGFLILSTVVCCRALSVE